MDRHTSPPRNRSRHATDSPKDKVENLAYSQEIVHPTSSMRGMASGPPTTTTTYPASGTSYLMQEDPPRTQSSHSQPPAYTTAQPYYTSSYPAYPSQDQYPQYPSYTMDSSTASTPSDSHTQSQTTYDPGQVYSMEYNSAAANGMMNAAMRDYDPNWLAYYRPQR